MESLLLGMIDNDMVTEEQLEKLMARIADAEVLHMVMHQNGEENVAARVESE